MDATVTSRAAKARQGLVIQTLNPRLFWRLNFPKKLIYPFIR